MRYYYPSYIPLFSLIEKTLTATRSLRHLSMSRHPMIKWPLSCAAQYIVVIWMCLLPELGRIDATMALSFEYSISFVS